ncbi:MAG: hypothetical protein ABS81_14610 [Pseudonocardia sp. SCN 72-86]|nr:MAG: hypothetical protein ABS81_14610 [Pseudonocardia sp. SCN 72-86]
MARRLDSRVALAHLADSLGHPFEARAACAGQAPAFDDVIDGEPHPDRLRRITSARRVCRTCPALPECTALVAREAPVSGVLAGRVREDDGPVPARTA